MRLFDYCERGNDKAKQGDIIGLRLESLRAVFHKAICRNDAQLHNLEQIYVISKGRTFIDEGGRERRYWLFKFT